MTRKFISLCLIAAMLLTMIPMSAFATVDVDAYIDITGLPGDWTNQPSDITITAKEGVSAMSVNGTNVQSVGGTIGGGVISENGKPYVKFKALDYDEDTGVLNVGAFIGNIESGKGHGASLFSFKYDTTNWAPYDLSCDEEITSIDYENHFIEDCFITAYVSKDKGSYYISDAQASKAKKVSLVADESGAMLDTKSGVAAVTWYSNVAVIDATEYEVPVFRFALIKKGNSNITENTITQPLVSELNSSISLFDKTISSSTQMGDEITGTIYTTAKDNIDYVVEALDGTKYGCEPSVPAMIKFEEKNSTSASFKVDITVNGAPYSKTYDVKYDNVKPTISVVPEVLENPVQKATFTVTANDDKSGIKEVLVNGAPINGNEYEVTASGTYEFKAVDNAGNESEVVTRTVTIDTDGPELEIAGNPTDWTNKDVVLTVSTEDDATVTVNDKPLSGKTLTVTENGTYTFVATDKAGNKTTKIVNVTKIDKTAPVITAVPDVTEPTKGFVIITVTTEDDATVTVNGEPLSVKTYTVTENGTYTFVATDKAGNKAEAVVKVENIDITAPVLQIAGNPDNWTKEDVVLTVTTEDDATVTVNDKPLSGKTLTVTENGTYTFVATDKAGNQTRVNVEVNKIDKAIPVVEISGNATDWTNENVVIEIDVTAKSGIAEILVDGNKIDGDTFTAEENKVYTVKVTNNAGNSVEKTVDVKFIDKIAPALTVSDAPVKPVKEHKFTVDASDVGSDIDRVTVSVNGASEEVVNGNEYVAYEDGEYVFTAYDKAGNSTSVTRNIAEGMIDTVKPEITVENAPGVDEWLNDSVELEVTVDEEATVLVYKDGTLVGEVKDGKFTVTESGNYSFKATDLAGNVSEAGNFIINIDKDAPVVSFKNLPETWVAAGYVVELDVEDAGESGIYSITVNGDEITANEFEINENIEYVVIVTDNAGNSKEIKTTIDKIDFDAPEILNLEYPTDWVAEGYISFNVADGASGIEEITVNGNVVEGPNVSFKITENDTYVIKVTDKVGNVSEESVDVEYIDTTAPVVEVIEAPTEACTEFTFVIRATDDESGIAKVTVNGFDATENGDGDWEYYIKADGLYKFVAYDNVGRVSNEVEIDVTEIDRVEPGITFPNFTENWTNSEIIIPIAVDKPYATLTVAKDGGDEVAVEGNSYTATENGTYVFTATDALGNVGTAEITITKIEKDAPVLTVSEAPIEWTKEYTFELTYSDALSGVKEVTVNGDKFEGTAYTVTENGEYKFVVTDNAGNKAEKTVIVDKIDKVAPAVEITGNAVEWTKEDVVLTVVAEDAQSGVAEIKVNGEAIDGTTYTATENGTYTFTVIDAVGNMTEKTVAVDKIDKTAPAVEIAGNAVEWTKEDVVLTITAEDAQSGVAEIKVNGEAIDGTTYTATENGTYTFTVTDAVGNVTEKAVTVDKIDKTTPAVEITGNAVEWTKEDVVLTVVAEDAQSGVAEIKVNGEAIDGTTYTATENGEYKFVVTDKVGNMTEKTVTVDKIDKTAPVFKAGITTSEVTETTINVALPTATDASGIAKYTLYLNDALVEGYNGEATYQFTDLAMATVYKIKLVATDAVGLEAATEITVSTTGLGKVEVSVDLSGLNITAEDMHMNAWIGDKSLPIGKDGKVVFENLEAGTYTVEFKAPGFFPVAKAEIVVEYSKTTVAAFKNNELVAGDSTEDGKINIFDLNAVASAFVNGYEGEEGLKYDFNRDGKVNLKDIQMLVKNYGKVK